MRPMCASCRGDWLLDAGGLHATPWWRHLSFAETESAMPLYKTEGQSPRSGHRAGAVLSRPQHTALPGGLADAVLEALPYTVAVLDHVGTIVAVNPNWGGMARGNGAPDPAEGGIGLNYPAVCPPPTSPGAPPAAAAAPGA